MVFTAQSGSKGLFPMRKQTIEQGLVKHLAVQYWAKVRGHPLFIYMYLFTMKSVITVFFKQVFFPIVFTQLFSETIPQVLKPQNKKHVCI